MKINTLKSYELKSYKELFDDTPKFMTACDFNKNDTPKFIFCSEKAPEKIAHPVPAYMVVTPLPPGPSQSSIYKKHPVR